MDWFKNKKGSFKNSKVLLPEVDPNAMRVLEEFNHSIDMNFRNYLNSVSVLRNWAPHELSLPLSSIAFPYKVNINDLGNSYSLLSPFVLLSGKSNDDINDEEIGVINSNIRGDLLADTIPKLNL